MTLDLVLTTFKYAVLGGLALGAWYLLGVVAVGGFIGMWNATMKTTGDGRSTISPNHISRWAMIFWPMFIVFALMIALFWAVVIVVGGCVALWASRPRFLRRRGTI